MGTQPNEAEPRPWRYGGLMRLALVITLLAASDSVADEAETDAGNAPAATLEDAGEWRAADTKYAASASAARATGALQDEQQALLGRFRCLEELFDYATLRRVAERLGDNLAQQGKDAESAVARSDLGGLLCELGEYGAALDVIRSAISVLEEHQDMVAVAHARSTLAIVFLARGEFAAAVEEGNASLALYEANDAHEDAAYARETIAAIHLELGMPGRALRHLDALLDETPESDKAAYGNALMNLGMAQYKLEDLVGAAKTLAKARELLQEAGARPALSRLAIHEGEIAERQGDAPRALAHYKEALLAARGHEDREAWARLKIGDAHVLAGSGQAGAALASYGKALASVPDIGDPVLAVECQRGRASALLLTGKWVEADRAALEALALLEVLDSGLANEQVAFMRANYSPTHAVALRAKLARGSMNAVFTMLERGRAGSLVAALGGSAALPIVAADSEERRKESEARRRLFAEQMRYNEVRRRRSNRTRRRVRYQALMTARYAHRDTLERLERAAKRDDRSVSRTAFVSARAFRAMLRPGDVHIHFVLRPTLAGALVTTRDASPRWMPLGSPKDVIASVERFAHALGTKGRAVVRVGDVAKAVLGPLGLPKSCRRLLVTPDGPLASIPFRLLVRAFTALPDDLPVAFLPSATVLEILQRDRVWSGTGRLALGDPDYTVDENRQLKSVYAGSRSALERLVNSGDELMANAGVDDARLVRKEASEAGLRKALAREKRWRIVHLACHGIADGEAPGLSSLALSPSGEDDGFLTTTEIFALRVNADLVVLSACDSAVGRSLAGEGVMGLSRAFMCAGAPRVLASLWRVDDKATAALMRRFHAELRRPGVSVSAALLRAQKHIRGTPESKWHHHRYWAAWVLWGLLD